MTVAGDTSRGISPDAQAGAPEPHLSHLAATIDIAAQVTARDADDLAAASNALAVCLDTLEFNMMLSTSILALLEEIRASEVSRKEVGRHLASAVDAFSSVTHAAAGGHVGVEPQSAALQPTLSDCIATLESRDSVLAHLEIAANDVHLLVEHADEQVTTIVAALERSRDVAVRGIEKTTAAHGLIGTLHGRLQRTSSHMRQVSDQLRRGAALIEARSGEADRLRRTSALPTGGQFAHTLVDDVANDLLEVSTS